ncbi:uncharacterized protein LOC125874406 isoform X3 [Solanum stenotomum]|uniref:uncharacterized protein LOC125874406 isoform X3 n=1 Tax=Solanum stenotomum TaxID=172797 RepID=UPI0020D13475|nr:uncharacterized protein LOC125874406 isoform X3 [Solanum stenotomum]
MTSLTMACCPNSFQLRLAFSCRKPPALFSGMRVRKLEYRRIRFFLFAGNDRINDSNCVGRRNTWVNSTPSVDGLGGWSETDDVAEKSADSKGKKQSFAGIVVAGAAGVILVTVLTFAALCIGKRNSTRVKHQREPLTVLQEMPMASDNHDDTVEDGIFLENSRMEKVLQALPGMVLVPAAIDQVQGQALAALQVLKVIEADVQPGDLCTRREYARWLVSASSVLSRTNASKVYPAMYIENVTELAFDDITLDDPDFPSIQGLAEAGLISSKLSRHDKKSSSYPDQSPFVFTPESPLSRQDLVSWKMALEKRQLPVVDQKSLQKVSGWIDTDKIHPDAWPALVADLSSGEWGIMALAFGYTRLFQPYKPVTKGQAAIALATGEASDTIVEELSRIEAESIAEKAVASYNSLAAQVEKDVSASFEKELILEKKRVDTMKKLAEEARQELESLRAERKAEHLVVMKERAAVDSELEVLSRFRHEVEEQLQSLKSDKIDISYEKERLGKLHRDAEIENQEIARLQFELEVERKALSIARAWAEGEAKRARERAKTLEAARHRWQRQGINKVVVDNDIQEDLNIDVTWLSAGNQSVEDSLNRTESLMDKLKEMADTVRAKSKETIHKIMEKIPFVISVLKEWAQKRRHKWQS